MKIKRDRTQLVFGNRLAQLRKERGLTQVDFCEEFSVFCGYQKQLLVPSISSWEQNHRLPSISTVVQLAMFFDVTMEYLFGMSDDRKLDSKGKPSVKGKLVSINEESLKYSDVPIKNRDLPKYNRQPVFVHFINQTHRDQWGLLNADTNEIICVDSIIGINSKIECFPVAPLSPVRTQISSLQQLMTTDYIWVEMSTADSEIKALYNGRYMHNERKDCLVKIDNGLALSYNGLDVSYWAFRG